MKYFIVSLCLFNVAAGVEWPFWRDSASFPKMRAVDIGTPSQTIDAVFLDMNLYCSGLWIKSGYPILGEFNSSASTTFHPNTTLENSVVDADNLSINSSDGKTQQLNQKLFNVIDKDGDCWKSYSYLSLQDSSKMPNYFFDSIFAESKESVVVMTYDGKPGPVPVEINGTLTIGERPSFCDQDWTTVPLSKNQEWAEWSFDLDKISMGKYSSFTPGNAHIDFSYNSFTLTPDAYRQIADLLDIDEEYNLMSCDKTDDIVFTVGKTELRITPDDYMFPTKEEGECSFAGKSSGEVDYYFTIPFPILRKQCYLIDYANKQIGFAQKIGN